MAAKQRVTHHEQHDTGQERLVGEPEHGRGDGGQRHELCRQQRNVDNGQKSSRQHSESRFPARVADGENVGEIVDLVVLRETSHQHAGKRDGKYEADAGGEVRGPQRVTVSGGHVCRPQKQARAHIRGDKRPGQQVPGLLRARDVEVGHVLHEAAGKRADDEAGAEDGQKDDGFLAHRRLRRRNQGRLRARVRHAIQ